MSIRVYEFTSHFYIICNTYTLNDIAHFRHTLISIREHLSIFIAYLICNAYAFAMLLISRTHSCQYVYMNLLCLSMSYVSIYTQWCCSFPAYTHVNMFVWIYYVCDYHIQAYTLKNATHFPHTLMSIRIYGITTYVYFICSAYTLGNAAHFPYIPTSISKYDLVCEQRIHDL